MQFIRLESENLMFREYREEDFAVFYDMLSRCLIFWQLPQQIKSVRMEMSEL